MTGYTKRICTTLLFVLLTFSLALNNDGSSIKVGVGVGIQSYPSAIDPYQLVESIPVLYPGIEMAIQSVGRIGFTANISRSVINGSLFGPIECPQFLELYTTGWGLDYNFADQNREFRIGFQMLAGFGEYGTMSNGDYFNPGWGLKLNACARRSISQHFSWGMRTGVQRLHIQLLPRSDELNLDSFTIETVVYFVL